MVKWDERPRERRLVKIREVDGLIEWIKAKKFEAGVEIKVTSVDSDELVNKTLPAGAFYEFHPRAHISKIYICPRNIFAHRGEKCRCGNACEKAKGKNDDKYEEQESLKMMRIEKKVIVHDEMLKENRDDS